MFEDRGDDVRKLGGVVAGCCVAGAVWCGSAAGAGIVTHAWMADDARAYVQDPALKALLDANRAQLRSGAAYPDSGYVMASHPGGNYGEEAHWPRFVEGYLAQIRATGCDTLVQPTRPCAAVVAHLMGAAAHGMGDEAWDWLMEPASVDRHETYSPQGSSAIFGTGGTEAQMDMIAVGRHHRPTNALPKLPSLSDLLATYRAIGRTDILSQPQIDGNAFSGGQFSVERGLAATHAGSVAAAMPWSATHMIVGPGGVAWAAKAIAAYYDSIWARLLGAPIPARVANVFPPDAGTGLPATGWTHDVAAGTRTGYARNRIVAALSDSPPFHHVSGDTSAIPGIPAGAMTLSRVGPGGQEAPVPLAEGYPKLVPYTAEAGEHLLDIQPAADLRECTTYRVRVTAALLDAAGAPFTPMTWTFRTGLGSGTPCPDDLPVTEPVDPATNPYVPIPGEPAAPVTCATTSVRLSVRAPRGAKQVTVTARPAGGKAVKLALQRGRAVVPLSATGKTTVTVRGRVGGRPVVATKTLPTCGTKTKATSVTLKARKQR